MNDKRTRENEGENRNGRIGEIEYLTEKTCPTSGKKAEKGEAVILEIRRRSCAGMDMRKKEAGWMT